MKDSVWYINFVLAVMLGVAWLDDIDEWWSRENTVYYIECTTEDTKPTDCPKDKIHFGTITFRVDPESQIVLSKSYGVAHRLGGVCSVWDRNDWICIKLASGFGTYVQMIHGEFKRGIADKSIAYISKAKWAFKLTAK